jgi:BirA family transcriptional regulator, biotin operon repressor / biotin---[acetyl-CoA-carboxylase] ligase
MHKIFPVNLLHLLQDQKIHSGEELGRTLKMTRAGIWKQLQALQQLGVKIESIKGNGYRLTENIDLLDGELITNVLYQKHDIHCDVVIEIDSTNSMLMRLLQEQNVTSGSCVVAEMQTEGRGRRGRKWVSPFAKNLYFSILWNFYNGLSGLEGLSLVIGISIVQVLNQLGLKEIKLKWPNDILANDKKLAGILLDVSGDPTGFCHVVIGVGLNVHMQSMQDIAIGQSWTSLDQEMDLTLPRSALLLLLIERLVENLRIYEKSGFRYFIDEWKIYDAYFGKEVIVIFGDKAIVGVAQGVNNSGELLVMTASGIQSFNGGEVSLRVKQP